MCGDFAKIEVHLLPRFWPNQLYAKVMLTDINITDVKVIGQVLMKILHLKLCDLNTSLKILR